jgi:hypothetical protein
MSATDPNPIPTGSTEGTGDPPFTPTEFQRKAEEIIRALDVLESGIPFLQQHHPASLPFITAHRSVPDGFLGTAVATTKRQPVLQRPGAPATERGGDVLQFLEAFKPVRVRVRQFGRNLDFTMGLERSNLAADCLTTYSLARRLVKDPSNGGLGEHVLAMKRDLGRFHRRRKDTPPSPPAPVPATPATTPPSTATPPANINPPATPVNGAAGH